MLNLAPVKYANCFVRNSGPIQSLESSELTVAGRRLSVANARLRSDLYPPSATGALFRVVGGTGVDGNPLHARFKAISEAMERWAFHATLQGEPCGRYGFDHDPTTNGMAAFPGLFARQARVHALREAVERYALIAWWHGLLGLEFLSFQTDAMGRRTWSYRILHPFAKHEVVLLRQEGKRGCSVYAFGGAPDLEKARNGAEVELERCTIVLESFFCQNPAWEAGDVSTISDWMERRILYFTTPEGVETFEQRVKSSLKVKPNIQRPSIRFDGEIRGPWSTYATVWRVALTMPTQDFLDPERLFFFW
jgi:hypothetical protein